MSRAVYAPVGRWIKARRIARRWSQRELGEKIGHCPSAVSAIERGEYPLALHKFLELVALLEPISISEITERLGQRPDVYAAREMLLQADIPKILRETGAARADKARAR